MIPASDVLRTQGMLDSNVQDVIVVDSLDAVGVGATVSKSSEMLTTTTAGSSTTATTSGTGGGL